MPPTMYRCGILVVTLLSVALSTDVQPAESATTDLSAVPATSSGVKHASMSMSYFCFFGKIPSASCRFKCHLGSKESYCDEEKKMCLCRATEEKADDSEELFKTSQQTENTDHHPTVDMKPTAASTETEQDTDHTGENKHHIIFYIFDLNKIFGQKQGSEEVSTTAVADTLTDSSQGGPEVVAAAGWNYQHLLALLVLAILVVLMVIELYAFYKKRNENKHFENIFNTITIPPPNKA